MLRIFAVKPQDAGSADSPITRFFLGQAVHSTGRTLDQILSMKDSDLARAHNVIQWLFPVDSPSVYWINAPFLSKGEVALFRRNPRLRRNYIHAFNRYIGLFRMKNLGDRIEISPDYNAGRPWLYPNSHSFEVITTILESWKLLWFRKEANHLLKALIDVNRRQGGGLIDKRTLNTWAQLELVQLDQEEP
jgi:hypothetical protein